MKRLTIRTLGPFQVHLDGEPVTRFDSDKVRGLLAYLALESERPHRREKLAGLLWPDFPERSARTNLRSALANLRKVIGDQAVEPNFLLVNRQTIQFNRESDYELDSDKFNKLVGTGNEHYPDQEQLEQAISLYSGDFMEGFSIPDSSIFEEWILVTREAFRRDVMQALQRLTHHYQELDRYETALDFALRQIEMEPFQEAAHQQAMWNWALSGRRNEAVAHYEHFRSTLESELGVSPLKQTQEMYQQLLAGDLPDPPTEVYILRHEPREVGQCPYRGLAAFREEDALFYHGREDFIQQLVEALKQRSLVGVIIGSSGTGKSSVVHAGLFPRLRDDGDWFIIDFRPAGRPFQSIATALLAALEPDLSEADRLIEANKLADSIRTGDLPLINVTGRILEKHPNASRLLLLVDQFEELYSLYPDIELRHQFIDMLIEATRENTPFVLLMTLRADFMGQVLRHRPMADALQDGTFIMGPMNREELRAAIREPAEKQGADFEPGLVNRILDDVGVEPGNLPLLEFALTLMWEQLEQGWFTHAAYEKIGRVEGALTGYTEKVYSELSEPDQEKARHIFVQLVQPGESTGDTRRIATRLELGEDYWLLIQKLADRRLVVTGREEGGQETVELIHEAMISGWNRIRDWMDADRSFRIWQENLRAAIRAWHESGRDEGALLRGAPLAQADVWLDERRIDLSNMDIEYIQASLAQQQEEQARRERRRRRTIIALAGGLVLTTILVLIALGQWRRAESERDIAFSRELAAAATSNLNLDPELSILLAMTAVRQPHSAGLPVPREAEEALHAALLGSRLHWTLPGGFGAEFSPDGTLLAASGPESSAIVYDFSSRRDILTLSGHSGDVYGVSVHFSSDGERLVTASADGTAKIWDVSTGNELLTLVGHTDTIIDGVFNPDGSLLATTSNDGTVRVWDAITGAQLLVLELPGAVFITFDPTGSLLAIAVADGGDGRGEIWDISTGQLTLTLMGHTDDVNDITYNKDGTKIATASSDGSIRVWDTSDGKELSRVGGQETGLFALDISPDDRFVAAGGFDGRAKIWDITSGNLFLILAGHNNSIFAVDFSPDGKYLVTASLDGTTKVWDISSGGNREWLTLAGHNNVVFSVDYSPDGKQIATSSWDGTGIVWDAISGANLLTLDDFNAEVARITYSPDGTKLATADYAGTVKVREASTGNILYSILAHSPGDIDVAFSPDGKYLASGGSDGIAKLWDSVTGDEVRSFLGHNEVIQRIAFSHDGTRLATASWDDTARIWDVSSGEQILVLSLNNGDLDVDVNSVDFSPDDKSLATTHKDSIARVWDVSTKDLEISPKLELVGHSNIVWDAAFSKDGTRIATLSFDGTARLWDAETGEELLVFSGNNDGPDLDFSPDGKFLATTSGDTKVRVYVLSIDDLISLAQQRVSRSLTPEECQKYLHLEKCSEDQ